MEDALSESLGCKLWIGLAILLNYWFCITGALGLLYPVPV